MNETKTNYSTDSPILTELALTNRCNLKCKSCTTKPFFTSKNTKTIDDISIHELKHIIDVIYKDTHIKTISFSGGEPTIRKKELLELIAYSKNYKVHVNLISNGTLIGKTYARELKMAGLDSAQIVIEGISANIHNTLTQVTGSFEKSIAAIGFLKDNNISVHTITSLNKLNLNECIQLPDFVSNVLEIKLFSLNLLWHKINNSPYNKKLLSGIEIIDIVKRIQTESIIHNVDFICYSPIPLGNFNSIKNSHSNNNLHSKEENNSNLTFPHINFKTLPSSKINYWINNKVIKFMKKEHIQSLCNLCDHNASCNQSCPIYWRTMEHTEFKKHIFLSDIIQKKMDLH